MELIKKEELLKFLEGKINHSEELKKAFESDEKLEAFYTGMNVALKDVVKTIETYFK